MASRLKRAWFSRAVVAMAVVAIPLLGAGSAQAAIAGAPPEKTTTRPDLISATILTQSAAGSLVDFCFDKSVANPGGGGGGFGGTANHFKLGGYRAGNAVSATSAALELNSGNNNPPFNCVRATFPAAAGDLNQYTIGSVLSGAVLAQGGNTNNLNDATPLTGSTSHNGTANFTTAPDLTGVLVDQTSNTITYVYDQNVRLFSGASTTNTDYFFTDSAGNTCFAVAQPASVSANTVTVAFGTSGTPTDTCFVNAPGGPVANPPSENVSDAVRAGNDFATVRSTNDLGSANEEDEVGVPNTSGTTAKPDLTSAQLESNGQAIDFTFDATVVPNNVACFFAGLSTGDEVAGNSAQVIATSTTQTTIRVTFPNLANYDEYVVKGIAATTCFTGPNGGAVSNSSGGTTLNNTPSAVPAGDNAGAFARGFTTGPDAFAAVLNKTTGVASISLDQRAFTSRNANLIELVDGTGNVIATANLAGVTFPAQAAGPETITAQFTQAQVGQAVNIAIQNSGEATDSGPTLGGSALETALGQSAPNCFSAGGAGCTNQPNVSQILATTSTAALAHASHVAVSRQHVSRAAARRAAARRRAALRRLRATSKSRLRHLAHRH